MYCRTLFALSMLLLVTGPSSQARAAPPVFVSIKTEPPSSSIYVDGKEHHHHAKGALKAPLKIKLAKGKHEIKLEHPGYRTVEESIEVTKPNQRFTYKLEQAAAAAPEAPAAKRGSLLIASPRGQIYVDGQNRGISPTLVENLSDGEHTVEVRESETSAPLWKEKVQVTAGTQIRLTANVASPATTTAVAVPVPVDSGASSNAELSQLRQQYNDLKQTLDDLRSQVGAATVGKPKHEANIPVGFRGNAMPGSALPGTVEKDLDLLHALSINVSATLRYEWLRSADQTDVLLGDNLVWNNLRARVRLGATYDQGPVVAGLRLTTGQTSNPTAPFTSLGDGFRAHSIALDHFYGTIRPLADYDRISLSFGAMPQPFWRGDRGTIRDELIWDDDISPEGIAMHVTFFKSKEKNPVIKLDNNLGYFTLNFQQAFRFAGFTGTTYVVAEQLHFRYAPYFNIAISYNDFGNLNAGLRVPTFTPTSAFPSEGESAYLLRGGGLQGTNNRRNYGIGATGFLADNYRVGNVLLQLDLPFPKLKKLGEPEIFLMGNYTRNFGVASDNNAWGVTLGIRAGSWQSGAFHPLNLWFTWRDVDADATLATIADSDLCTGTGCRGLEFGANYRIYRHLLAQISYFDWLGFPLKDFRIQRLLVDLVADF